jgi:hypothetical protein
MGVAWTIHNAIVPPKSDYEKLKRKINKTTLTYGTALTSTYFITQGAPEGVSSTLGVASSLAYIALLENHVDNIEKSSFQKQFFVPLGTAIFETMWNHAPFGFDFDYGATFVGFLAYKLALLTVLYEEVVRMMITESEPEKDRISPLDSFDSALESEK